MPKAEPIYIDELHVALLPFQHIAERDDIRLVRLELSQGHDVIDRRRRPETGCGRAVP